MKLENIGAKMHYNLTVGKLVEAALKKEDAALTDLGALNINTGKYTGRSPGDRFIVDDPSIHDKVDWGKGNVPISPEKFEKLYNKMLGYIKGKELFIFDGFVGADKNYRMPIRVINEYASQNLFAQNLFIKPKAEELEGFEPEYTIYAAPGCLADAAADGVNSEAFIILNFARKIILIGGSKYCGEIKKSIFTVMNFILPQKGVMPMHCSANIGKNDDVALFFGLSGTGKTTLSADKGRRLIGDDEHGWTDNGVFNFEGGCYAKCIRLSKENEPQIWNAIRFGTILENVVLDQETGVPDYDSEKYTENTRAGYPVTYIDGAVEEGAGGNPSTIVFLTADATGVLPPISKLTKEQAMYHFMSGYTSKLAGTERGIIEPTATFSTCFGAPFMPMKPQVYAELLGKKIDENNSGVFLVNTGWAGGSYGVGKRMKLSYTRAMVNAAISGKLDNADYDTDPIFGLAVPTECPGVPSEVLKPVNVWQDKSEYEKTAVKLARDFNANFQRFKGVSEDIVKAGPIVK
ncbi:MAG TPA: phosphoenolpyruvate carboxykinase (ATP) [Bacillota bacterium]|nr:phosphoenolpyruvate carboxykinase (ATP) [Bacillota bacterium]HPL54453.1 phosphoenolpyruvate carboxykinase (ATP) [Bacillota bacterium]